MNQTLYEQLLNATMMIFQREKYQKKIAELKQEIELYNRDLKNIQSKIHGEPEGYSDKKGWGKFLVILSSFFVVCCCIAFFPNLMMGSSEAVLIISIAFFVFFTLLVVGVVLLVSARKSKINYNISAQHEYEKTKREIIDPAINKNNEKIRKLEKDSAQFWELHKSIIEFLPEKYQTLDALASMLESVRNLRTNTLTDAINMYEEEVRWRKMQSAVANQTMLQQMQSQRLNDALREIEQNQQKLHSDLQTIQTMQFIDLLNK